MSDHDELRDALAPAGEPLSAHSLTASEVRKLGTARLHRQQAGRAGIGALAVAAVVGLVAVDPMGLAHDHRGGAALGSPSYSATHSPTWSVSPRVIPSSAASGMRVSGTASASPRPGNNPAIPRCASANPAWAAALAQPDSPSSMVVARTAAGTVTAQQDASAITWVPRDDPSRPVQIQTFAGTGANHFSYATATDSLVAFSSGDGIWTWDHHTLRRRSDAAHVGPIVISGGDLYYVDSEGGSRRLHRIAPDDTDTLVPNTEPGGILQGGYYVVSNASAAKVWDLAGNAMAGPPPDLTPSVQVAGSYNGQPVYWSADGLAFANATNPVTWTKPGWAVGRGMSGATVAGTTVLAAFPDEIVAMNPLTPNSPTTFAGTASKGTTRLSTSGDPSVLTIATYAPAGSAGGGIQERRTPVSSLPDLQGC